MNVTRAVLTLWFVNASDPAAVLRAEPKADRGFGRKFLAQLNPAFPITPIGQFPLNRSAHADTGEYYVGGYQGITVVQTVIEGGALKLSTLPPALLYAQAAHHIYAFAVNEEKGYAGVAHWEDSILKRSLCSTPTEFIEDSGLPEPFEGPFWAGERPNAHTPEPTSEDAESLGIGVPFDPIELLEAAEVYWLGIEIGEDGPDLDVVGYAVDGRPEPKVASSRPLATASQAASAAAAKLGLGPANGDYDDYADPSADRSPTLAEAASSAAHGVASATAAMGRRTGRFISRLPGRISHRLRDLSSRFSRDRPNQGD